MFEVNEKSKSVSTNFTLCLGPTPHTPQHINQYRQQVSARGPESSARKFERILMFPLAILLRQVM